MPDEFEELTRAKKRIREFFDSPATAGGDAAGVLKDIHADIEAYIQRKRRQKKQA